MPERRLSLADTPLVLLNGWGGVSELWRPLQTLLQACGLCREIICIDLPGFGNQQHINTDQPLAWLAQALPERSVVLGWSLGGQLAAALQQQQPERFAKLLLLASNSQFVASADWPGMSAAVFENFCLSFAAKPARTWQKFVGLCAAGDPSISIKNFLNEWPQPSNCEQAARSLGWLAQIHSHYQGDVLLAAADALVPSELAHKNPRARVVAGSHLLPISQPQCILQYLLDVMQQLGAGVKHVS